MKSTFSDYLASIGITSNALKEKAQQALDLATVVAPGKIQDIFIHDWIQEDGSRAYGDFECVSEGCLIAVLSFVTLPSKVEIANLRSSVIGAGLEFKDFDFKSGGKDSRLSIEVNIGHVDTLWEFKASRGNCDKLLSFYTKYIKANFRSLASVVDDSG